MTRKIKIFLVAATFFCASNAAADGNEFRSYGAIQLIEATYSSDDFDDVNPTGVVARVGLLTSDRLAAELRVTFRMQDDNVDIGGIDTDVEIDYMRGVYAVYHFSTTIENSFYAVLGYTEAEIVAGANGQRDHLDERGPSIGAGLNFGGFNVEFMQYFAEDDYDASAIAFGYVTRF